MLKKAGSIIVFAVGVLNLLPAIAFFDVSKFETLYGAGVKGDSMLVLMRHRGILLAAIGLALIFSFFRPETRGLAICIALLSKAAFIFLAFSSAASSPEIARVAAIDVVASILLFAAFLIWLKPDECK